MTKLRTSTVLWASGIAVVTLIAYGIMKGYHEDPELLVTVIVVRLAAALGIGLGIGTLLAAVMLVRRKQGVVVGFFKITLMGASVTVIVLAILNLVTGR